MKANKEIRNDFKKTYESVRYFMKAKKIPRPKSFKHFWSWYKIKYSAQLSSFGFTEISRKDIVDFGINLMGEKQGK